MPVYYFRTGYYGRLLTDTVRLNGFNTGWITVGDLRAVGDGNHTWCSFRTPIPGQSSRWGVYMTERDAQGEEIYPAQLLDYPLSDAYGPLGYNAACAFLPGARTIHWTGLMPAGHRYRYARMTASADTLIGGRRIDGVDYRCSNVTLVASPHDGHPWASMVVAAENGGFDGIRLVRFNADTSQTVYHPLPETSLGIWPNSLAIDGHGDFFTVMGCDFVHAAFVLLDSVTQQVREWRTIDRTHDCFASVVADSAGNCGGLLSFVPGVRWFWRSADGSWPHPPAEISANLDAWHVSIVQATEERFAFTATCIEDDAGKATTQMRLYTFGFPLDTAQAPDRAQNSRSISVGVSAYPNPFSAALQIEMPDTRAQAVVLYDVLGREVWSKEVAEGVRQMSVTDARLGELPSGTYYLAVKGSSVGRTRVMHVK